MFALGAHTKVSSDPDFDIILGDELTETCRDSYLDQRILSFFKKKLFVSFFSNDFFFLFFLSFLSFFSFFLFFFQK